MIDAPTVPTNSSFLSLKSILSTPYYYWLIYPSLKAKFILAYLVSKNLVGVLTYPFASALHTIIMPSSAPEYINYLKAANA